MTLWAPGGGRFNQRAECLEGTHEAEGKTRKSHGRERAGHCKGGIVRLLRQQDAQGAGALRGKTGQLAVTVAGDRELSHAGKLLLNAAEGRHRLRRVTRAGKGDKYVVAVGKEDGFRVGDEVRRGHRRDLALQRSPQRCLDGPADVLGAARSCQDESGRLAAAPRGGKE